MESKNLSIMLTDLKGFTARSSSSSRESISDFVKTHNALIRPIVDFYRGRVVKGLGDAFLCVFDSATDAAICSIAITIVIHEFNKMQKSGAEKLNIRILLNSGDVTLDQGDIYGDAVNVLSRMEKLPAFEAGGIGISESTYLLMNRQEISAEFLGEHTFKGISHPVKVYRLPLEKQKLSELPTRLLELVQNIAAGKKVLAYNKAAKKLQWKAAAAAAVLLVIGGVYYYQAHKKEKLKMRDEAITVLRALRASESDEEMRVLRADFQGPVELFDKLDVDHDGVVGPPEVRGWALDNDVDLPPPPGPGMRRGRIPGQHFGPPGVPRGPRAPQH
jgi:class 3 adenylate cyclase